MSSSELRDRLIKLAYEHPNIRRDLLPLLRDANTNRSAAVRVRKMITGMVKITGSKELSSDGLGALMDAALQLEGIMTVDAGQGASRPLRFTAYALQGDDGYVVTSFHPQRPMTGSDADTVLFIWKDILQDALNSGSVPGI